ncbi:hypothetical protein BT67DRAFT_1059 [Trichocladium antarcticum]|uniref:Uncharacterized protein n=1 Tax=Trichocladium antarcticum TaxID=1450529 RepID=A0AAN6ZGD7_9PEZI|nr:hypothetical protein BT67DRAFT_1059 [Trichocladium antarcticum]
MPSIGLVGSWGFALVTIIMVEMRRSSLSERTPRPRSAIGLNGSLGTPPSSPLRCDLVDLRQSPVLCIHIIARLSANLLRIAGNVALPDQDKYLIIPTKYRQARGEQWNQEPGRLDRPLRWCETAAGPTCLGGPDVANRSPLFQPILLSRNERAWGG